MVKRVCNHQQQTVASSLESYQILFSTYIQYSHVRGKYKRIYRGLCFCEVADTRYDIPSWHKEEMYVNAQHLPAPQNTTLKSIQITVSI
jgi:hypothetical protein